MKPPRISRERRKSSGTVQDKIIAPLGNLKFRSRETTVRVILGCCIGDPNPSALRHELSALDIRESPEKLDKRKEDHKEYLVSTRESLETKADKIEGGMKKDVRAFLILSWVEVNSGLW